MADAPDPATAPISETAPTPAPAPGITPAVGVAATVAAVDAPVSVAARAASAPTAPAAVPGVDVAEFERMKSILNDRNHLVLNLQDIEGDIAEWDKEIKRLIGEIKDARKERETCVAAMRMAIRAREDKQKRIDFDKQQQQAEAEPEKPKPGRKKNKQADTPPATEAAASAASAAQEQPASPSPATTDAPAAAAPAPDDYVPPANDPYAATTVMNLGIPEGWATKLRDDGIDTLGRLEWHVASGKAAPGSPKGISARAWNEIREKVALVRQDHPIPQSAPESEQPPAEQAAPAADPTTAAQPVAAAPVSQAAATTATAAPPSPDDGQEWKETLGACDRLIPRAAILINKLGDNPATPHVVAWKQQLEEIRAWVAQAKTVTFEYYKKVPAIEASLAKIPEWATI